jgi:hypothetical protein
VKAKSFITADDRMTLKEISGIVDIGVNTLQRRAWRHRTGCPIKKIGRNLVAYRPQFNEWLENYNG